VSHMTHLRLRPPTFALAAKRRRTSRICLRCSSTCANEFCTCMRNRNFACVTKGLANSVCTVGGNSSLNHISGARCIVKNFSGGMGSHLFPRSEMVVMKDRIAQ
jgi:hypothetical protein